MPGYFQGSKGAQVRVMGVAVLLLEPQNTRARGSSLGHHLVGKEEESLFHVYFIGSEETVSSKGWI